MSSSLGNIEQKVAFITGASRGIGQACAVALAKKGVHCILSARTQGGLIQTDNMIRAIGGKSTLLPFDLADNHPNQKIDAIGPSIASHFQRLDFFIHAAFHYIPLTSVTQITDQIWERNLTTNLTSCRKLIRTLSPILCATSNAQAAFLQGITAPNAFWSPVATIQAALQTIVLCWQEEIKQLSTVKVHYITPHPTNTLLRRSFFPAEDKQKLASAEETATHIIQKII